MSAYNPPKNQPPIFDTTQFYNQEQEKLNYPIAQGTETFGNIIINGSIIIPATPIAYLNNTQTFTGVNTFNGNTILTTTSITNLSVSGTLSLPAGSVADSYLTSNIPKKNTTNTFTLLQTLNGGLSVTGTLTLPASSIADSYLTSNVPLKNTTNTFTLLQTLNGGLSVTGTLTLPATSIADSYLTSNVPLKNANNTYTGDNTFATIKFTNSTSVQQITLYEVSSSNYAENYSITINPYTLRYNTNSTGNHIFSTGTGTTYTDVATINSTSLTMNQKISMRSANFIELLDSTNLIGSYIYQDGINLGIDNYGIGGAVIIDSANLDLTNTYTTCKGGSTAPFGYSTHFPYDGDGQNYISGITNLRSGAVNIPDGLLTCSAGLSITNGNNIQLSDPSNIYLGSIYVNSSQNFIFENQNNSGSIVLKTYLASVLKEYKFDPFALTLPGSANLLQTISGIISQTGSGSNTLKAINMQIDNNLSQSGTGIISQTGTGSNTLKAINMVAGTNITQTTTSIIDQSSSTGGINLLKSITMNAAANFLQSTTGVITQTGTGSNTLKAINMVAGTNITQTTTSIIDQSSSTGGINLLKSITMNAAANLLQSTTGVITQSGTGTNAFKGSTFSGSNTHFNGSSIFQYDPTNTYYSQLYQNGITYYIQNLTPTGGYIITSAYNGTSLIELTNLHYTAFGIRTGVPLRIWESTNTKYSELNQSGVYFGIVNGANSGITTIRNLDASGIANDIGISFYDMTISKNVYIQQSKVLILQDNHTTISQTNISQNNGTFSFSNLANPLTAGGNTIFNLYNTIGTLLTAFQIYYSAITAFVLLQCNAGLSVIDSNITQTLTGIISQSGTGTNTLKTTTCSGLLTCNAGLTLPAGTTLTLPNSSISDSALSSNIPKLNASATFTSDLIVYTSGSNYLKITDGASTTRISQNLGDCLITNTKTYSGGFGDIIFTTTDTGGSASERFRVSYNQITTNVNIKLQSTFTTPTTGQLGFKVEGYPQYPPVFPPFLPPSAFPITLTSGAINWLAEIAIPTGVWNVVGQFYYYVNTGTTITGEEYSISTTNNTIDNDNLLTFGTNTSTATFRIVRRINTIITNTTSSSVLYYLTMKLSHSSGSYQWLYNDQATYAKFYAVRIA